MTSDSFNHTALQIRESLITAHKNKADKTAQRSREELFPDYNRVGLGVALEWENMGNQFISPQLEEQANNFGVEFEHLGLTLGTVLHNIDLSAGLDQEVIDFVRQVFLERKVIFFHDQNLSEQQQIDFARHFGELDVFPFNIDSDNPLVLELNHNDQYPGNQNGWHTDVTWMEKPSMGSVAQCVLIPPVGGDTLFSDSYAVYLGLPPDLQERLQYLAGINDYRSFLSNQANRDLPEELVAEIKSKVPFGVSHPLLRTHPETGKTSLFLHAAFIRHDSLYDTRTGDPIGAEESQDIVARLTQQHARPEYTCRFQWGQGSVAFWDNRAVQHYANSDYYPHQRILRRVTISGDRPYYKPVTP